MTKQKTKRICVVFIYRNEIDNWVGPGLSGDCKFEEPKIACNISFNNININTDAIQAELKLLGSDQNEIAKRVNVSQIFLAEPIGIVEIKISNLDLPKFRVAFPK